MSLFLISLYLKEESEILFSIIYVFSAFFIALFVGRGAGVIAGILVALSVDYHYGPRQGFAFLLIILFIMQLTLAVLRLLQQSVENAKKEQKRAEEAVRAREEILSVVAHDLRQPLSAIGMRAGLIQQMLSEQNPDSAQKYLSETSQDVGRIDRMIGDLLDLAKIDSKQISVKKQIVDLVELTTRVVNNLKSIHPTAQIKMNSSSQIFILADADRFQQILGNLLSNAIKYGKPDTEIQVDLSNRDQQAEISVTNEGSGISESQLPTVFDRFVRTPEAKKSLTTGLGLGLYITKGLIEAQDGKIWAESTLNKKTSFHFMLPISKEAPVIGTKPLTPDLNQHKKALNGAHVLLVDDSPDSLALLQVFLQKAGARVTAASSASDAMIELVLNRPDVIISDIEMPGDDGYALLKKIQRFQSKDSQRIPVVALTAHSNEKELKKIVEAGFDLHLSKPISFDKLFSSVKALVENENRQA